MKQEIEYYYSYYAKKGTVLVFRSSLGTLTEEEVLFFNKRIEEEKKAKTAPKCIHHFRLEHGDMLSLDSVEKRHDHKEAKSLFEKLVENLDHLWDEQEFVYDDEYEWSQHHYLEQLWGLRKKGLSEWLDGQCCEIIDWMARCQRLADSIRESRGIIHVSANDVEVPTSADTVTRQDNIIVIKGEWVSTDDILYIESIELRKLTDQRFNGKKSTDGKRGIDSKGRRWKKITDNQNEKPLYFVEIIDWNW